MLHRPQLEQIPSLILSLMARTLAQLASLFSYLPKLHVQNSTFLLGEDI